MGKYYITTTAPYVNAEPHIGFALEIIQADVLARYHELAGEEVFFNTGTDEHGKKIYEKAQEEGREVKEYVDEYAAKFRQLKELLGLAECLHFSRTTDEQHILAAQEMWRRVAANGYIRKGIYRAKYCIGCELEKQDSELENGRCVLHPNKEIELIEEENYFFCFSKLQEKLLAHYERYPDFVIPAHRQKEITNFVKAGLADFSISRLKSKMPWGISVPGDDSQVMYVWFDALTYYISALGWPKTENEKEETAFRQYWGESGAPRARQIAGKDNLRQQASMWQAILLAAELPVTRQIMIHGFITSGGTKMSKSLGNVVKAEEYAEKYGFEALRYYLLAKMDPFEDSDFTKEKFEEAYRADLQNGLGNLVSRVAAMAVGENEQKLGELKMRPSVAAKLEQYRFDEAMGEIWQLIKGTDQLINETRVWEKTGAEKAELIRELITRVRQVALDLAPLLPQTSAQISAHFAQTQITKITPLFPRLA